MHDPLTQTASPPISAGGKFSFMCHKSQGAMLVTTTRALLYDAQRIGAFEKYLRAQSTALESLIEREELGIALSDIILVTECCLTKDWAIMVVRDSESSASFGFELGPPGTALQATVSRFWSSQTQVPLHQWSADAPLQASIIGKPEPDNNLVYSRVEGPPVRTQCIFLRGYRVSRRRPWPGLRIRAAAGPDELPKDQFPPSGPASPISTRESEGELVVSDESLRDPLEVR